MQLITFTPKNLSWKILFGILALSSLCLVYAVKGVAEIGLNADFSRDLGEISNLWIHHLVWLGPELRVGFPASPLYFYLLFPLVLVTRGSANSLAITEALLATTALGFFAWANRKKSTLTTCLMIGLIGLSPWWFNAATHTWNGYMYVIWVFAALSSLWFDLPLGLSALLSGVAIAIHPAAIFLLPLLGYEWWRRKHSLVQAVIMVAGVLIPWLPIIGFEVITKGFLTREFLSHYSSSGPLVFNIHNFMQLANISGVTGKTLFLIWPISFLVANRRQKIWLAIISIPAVGMGLLSLPYQYYLLGLICMLHFMLVIIWSHYKIGQLLLSVIIGVFALAIISNFRASQTIPYRPISHIKPVVDQVIASQKLDHSVTYAVSSINGNDNVTPQADDYRFFLRVAGYDVVNAQSTNQAERLIVFNETQDPDPNHFKGWHIDQFGERQLVTELIFNQIKVDIFKHP